MHARIRKDPREYTVASVREAVSPVLDRWPIQRAWLYGSVARGEQGIASDVDLAYELTPNGRMGWEVWTLQQELEEALGVDVDISSTPDRRRAHAPFLEAFDRDKVIIYERAK